MRLRCLAGGYAGQVLTYSHLAGVAALRSGTAVRLDQTPPARTTQPAAAVRPVQSKSVRPARRAVSVGE